MALFHELTAGRVIPSKTTNYQFADTEEVIRIVEEYGYRTRCAEPNSRRIGDEVRIRRRRGDVNDIRDVVEARFAVVAPGEFMVWAAGDYESLAVPTALDAVKELISLLGVPDNRRKRPEDDESYGL